ncbi:alkaline-phosphatase-like protein [Sporodiniella umbellata]|nr:alkaline-phosphatase-like protein [Sporodiniella umbellata]
MSLNTRKEFGLEERNKEYNQEEEARLLNNEELSEDDDWATTINEDGDEESPQSVSLIHYICIGFSIGFVFFLFRLLLMYFGHMHHTSRPAEKLYFNGSDYFSSTVLLISLSGFRPDYLSRDITPNLNTIAKNGVKAERMQPVFPLSLFPNHWTLTTGLFPEMHGIVRNSFYDNAMGAFEYKNESITSNKEWWKGEPIWLTSRINRKKSASIMWPGTNTHHNTPDYVIPFNESMNVNEQLNAVLDWIDLPYSTRPHVITVRVPQRNYKESPDGLKADEYIKEIDEAIGYFFKELSIRNLDSHVNTIIAGDHGLEKTSREKLIYIDDILPKHLVKYVKNSVPSSLLDFQHNISPDIIQEIYQKLIGHTKTSHFKVYLKDQLPTRYHYSQSSRISPIQVIPSVGYQFTTHKMGFVEGGEYEGYDNLEDKMGAVFLAKGPKISKWYKPGTVLAPFLNVEVYGFMTELLNIDAAPNNGTMKGKLPILYEPPLEAK